MKRAIGCGKMRKITPAALAAVAMCGLLQLRTVGSLDVAPSSPYASLSPQRCVAAANDVGCGGRMGQHLRGRSTTAIATLQDLGRLQLRLRGGLRAETPRAENVPAVHGDPGSGCLPLPSDKESAGGCLPSSGGSVRQLGEPTVEVEMPKGTLRRMPTPVCLEIAAIDAIVQQPFNAGPCGSPRYAWDPRRRTWLLFKRPDEDLSIESLRGKWEFAPSDCLTFRHRRPDKWQHVDWAEGWLGWLEFFFWVTPVLNQLLYLWRGLFPCAVCGLARSKHPCDSERQADAAFWQAVRFRDIELAVRLVRGGVECDPGGANWCLLVSCIDARLSVCVLSEGRVSQGAGGLCAATPCVMNAHVLCTSSSPLNLLAHLARDTLHTAPARARTPTCPNVYLVLPVGRRA